MAEVLKADTKGRLTQLQEPEGFSSVEAGGYANRPHNDLTNETSRQNRDSPFVCLYC